MRKIPKATTLYHVISYFTITNDKEIWVIRNICRLNIISKNLYNNNLWPTTVFFKCIYTPRFPKREDFVPGVQGPV